MLLKPKSCEGYQRLWAKQNPEKVREYQCRYHTKYPNKRAELARRYRAKRTLAYLIREKYRKLRARYGLTPEQYKQLISKGCMICKSSKRLHVDHDHKINRVRGVLCENCNRGIGMFKESPSLLLAAIGYVNANC